MRKKEVRIIKALACAVFAITFMAVVVGLLIASSGVPANEVSREPIDVRYTEAHTGIETDYVNKYDVYKGEFVLLPETKTVHHNAEWAIQYRITYDNGKQKTKWCACTELEYNRVKAVLIAGGADNG